MQLNILKFIQKSSNNIMWYIYIKYTILIYKAQFYKIFVLNFLKEEN